MKRLHILIRNSFQFDCIVYVALLEASRQDSYRLRDGSAGAGGGHDRGDAAEGAADAAANRSRVWALSWRQSVSRHQRCPRSASKGGWCCAGGGQRSGGRAGGVDSGRAAADHRALARRRRRQRDLQAARQEVPLRARGGRRCRARPALGTTQIASVWSTYTLYTIICS